MAVNKTKEVLSHLEKNPQASVSEIVEALKQKKIQVSPAYVSNIKSKARRKSQPSAKPVAAARTKAAPAREQAAPNDDVAQLLLAKRADLLEAIASIDKTLELLGRTS